MKKNIKKNLSFLAGMSAITLPVLSLSGSCTNAKLQEFDPNISAFVKDLDYTNQTLNDFKNSGIDTTLDRFLILNGEIVPAEFKNKLQNARKVRVFKDAGTTEVEFKLNNPIKVKFKYFTEDRYSEPIKRLLKKAQSLRSVCSHIKDFSYLEVEEKLVSFDSPLEFRNYDGNGRLEVLRIPQELRRDFALYVSKPKYYANMTYHLKRFYSKNKVVEFKTITYPSLEREPIVKNQIYYNIVTPASIKTFLKRWLYASKLSKSDVSLKRTGDNAIQVNSDNSSWAYNDDIKNISPFLHTGDDVTTQMKKINPAPKYDFVSKEFTFYKYDHWNYIKFILSKERPFGYFLKYEFQYRETPQNYYNSTIESDNSLIIPILAWKMETSELDAMDWKNAIKINPVLNAEENIKWKDTPIYLRTSAGSDVNYYMVLEFDKRKIKVINNAANEVRFLVPDRTINGKKEIVISKETVDNFADSYNGEYQKLDSASFIFG